MGSGYMTKSGGSSTSSPLNSYTESLNGLKFGKKIYFEDAGARAPSKTGTVSSSGNPARKARGGAGVQGGQPPRCQVEGCMVDLSHAKAYYSKHKVCGMHSKSPKVIVAGLEKRFCQQCGRFHLLPEFDQGKRSCRRRLAGHNERRRKPPPGLLLASHGRFSSSILENSSRGGGFLVDFTAYPRLSGPDAWPTSRSSEPVLGKQRTISGRFTAHAWQSNSQDPPSELLVQSSVVETGFSSPGISSGGSFNGVADSSCALSLLSNQQRGSRNRASDISVNNLVNPEVDQYTLWGFKVDEGTSSHEMCSDLWLGQISQGLNSPFSGNVELSQQGRRQYSNLEDSRAYDESTQHMQWSL